MRRDAFPDPAEYRYEDWTTVGDYLIRSEGIVAFGTPLSVANLREAYYKGIFPWHTDGLPLPWHCPPKRAILIFDELHIPRSLARARRDTDLTFTIDNAFREVMNGCSAAFRPGQRGTWITQEFKLRFGELFDEGHAHSVEAWDADGNLVGGLYGVDAGGVFCGESMFYTQPNASKLALLHLIDHLQSRGASWLDNQVITPHFRVLGAREITRAAFLKRLKDTQRLNLRLFD